VSEEAMRGFHIPVFGPYGLQVERTSHVVVEVVPPSQTEATEVTPPDPEDPYVVCFKNISDLHKRSGLRRIRRVTACAARDDQRAIIVVKCARVVPKRTFAVLDEIGRDVGLYQISFYVKRTK
jgi:hypothetical protein